MFVTLLACSDAGSDSEGSGDTVATDTDTHCTPVSWWVDADADGYGAGSPTSACDAPAGSVDNNDDCDDALAERNPGATEACDGIDNNCDGYGDDDFAVWYTDSDGDGFGDPATALESCSAPKGAIADGTDCDDTDAAVNPDADEVCGDGDDDDCDGNPDTSDETATWHSDDDGDGYGHLSESETSCDPPEGWVLDGTDCVPGDASAHPGAEELCNEFDDNCDYVVDEGMDVDGDGYRNDSCDDGDDCDDLSSEVHPGALDPCEDGIDGNCDGGDTHCGYEGEYELASADAKGWASTGSEDAGRWLDAGDVDGDGSDDVIVATMYARSYAGGGYVLPGPVTGSSELSDMGYHIEGDASITYGAGRSLGVADIDGDGIGDVGFGAPYASSTAGTYVMLGPIDADGELATDGLALTAGMSNYCGHGTDMGDVTGDGVGDVLVGCYTSGGGYVGVIYVAFGPIDDDMEVDDDGDATLTGDIGSGYMGRHIRAGGDVNGDGVGDIVAPAPYATSGAPACGVTYVVYGPPSDLDMASADATLVGPLGSGYSGSSVNMGDIDGDGYAEVMVGGYGSGSAGIVYVAEGPASGDVDLDTVATIIENSDSGELFGAGGGAGGAIASEDVDSDGYSDILIGAYGDTTTASGAGAAFLYYGPATGTLSDTDAEAVFYGESSADYAGTSVALGDLDADGILEVIVGAPGENTGGSGAGAAYVFYPAE